MTLSEEAILSPDRIESTAFTVDLATFRAYVCVKCQAMVHSTGDNAGRS